MLYFIIFTTINTFAFSLIEGTISQSLSVFVANIYQNYSEENFEYIYENLYPSIKELITVRDYSQFQSENFNRYNLKIGKIKIDENISEASLPDYFSGIVDDKIEVYKVPIEYEMIFSVGGNEQKQEIEKGVFVGIEDDQMYLLWNPAVMNN